MSAFYLKTTWNHLKQLKSGLKSRFSATWTHFLFLGPVQIFGIFSWFFEFFCGIHWFPSGFHWYCVVSYNFLWFLSGFKVVSKQISVVFKWFSLVFTGLQRDYGYQSSRVSVFGEGGLSKKGYPVFFFFYSLGVGIFSQTAPRNPNSRFTPTLEVGMVGASEKIPVFGPKKVYFGRYKSQNDPVLRFLFILNHKSSSLETFKQGCTTFGTGFNPIFEIFEIFWPIWFSPMFLSVFFF